MIIREMRDIDINSLSGEERRLALKVRNSRIVLAVGMLLNAVALVAGRFISSRVGVNVTDFIQGCAIGMIMVAAFKTVRGMRQWRDLLRNKQA